MNRRDIFKLALSTPVAAAQAAREGSPNFLWVCTDQQRFDTIEGLNNPHLRTPNLKKLMGEGVTFTHAYVQSPVCSPSRACFLTGRYPHTTGLRANGQRIRETERLVPRLLADFGYECGLVGKLHLSPCANSRVEDRIDDGYKGNFWWSHDLSDQWPGRNMWREWLQAQGVRWPANPPGPVWSVPIDRKYSQAAWCADTAIRFMQAQKEYGPWLMSVNMFQPHHPFWPIKEFFDRYDPAKMPDPAYREGELEGKPVYQQVDHRGAYAGSAISFAQLTPATRRQVTAAYYAMIEHTDFELGRMLEALERSGQAENTVVIFTTDHGEMLGDHGIYLKGPYFYDPAIRVPLMIRWPKGYRAGLKVDAMVEMADLAPTLLEAAGMPPHPGMQGRSLGALLRGERTEHRSSIYSEFYDANFRYTPTPMATCVRTRQHKLTYYRGLPGGELYDLEKDPGEVTNLWGDPKARDAKEAMLLELAGRMTDTVDPLPMRNAPW